VSVLAAVRPDSWNFPLLLHVVGAMVLVGGLVVAVTAQLLGWRRQPPAHASALARFSFLSLVLVAFPAWWLMRISAQWIYSRAGFDDAESEPAWIGIGFVTGDAGGVLLLVTIIVAGIGARRVRRANAERSTLGRVATVLTALILVANLVAVWAMSAKPD
jgi:hypothetical protein